VSRLNIVALHSDELKFSSGHFMIISPDRRETAHGHDYQLSVAIHTLITHNGLSFDCRNFKQKLIKICRSLDYRFLLPTQSEYLSLEETQDSILAHFNDETLTFLKKDSVLLPINNVTLEELSYWFLQQITQDAESLKADQIIGLKVKILNGRGESGTSLWGNLSELTTTAMPQKITSKEPL
jgi:6-pyruvoyltetrahydropterin/6-carboxytetrahydropterin synthase